MNRKLVSYSAAALALVLFAIWLSREAKRPSSDATAHSAPASSIRPRSELPRNPISAPQSFAAKPANQLKIATDALYAPDVRALYDQHKDKPDPTGETSYYLAKALDECTPYVGKTADQISKSMNAVGQTALENGKRSALISRLIDRCKGFNEWDRRTLIDRFEELRNKAIAAGYPAAVASNLANRISVDGIEKSDETAISLLSSNPDGEVVKGIYDYLFRRNGGQWLATQGDPATVTAAWLLLQCNMGSDCGDHSHVAITACLYMAACDQSEVVSVLPYAFPSLNPERLDAAIRIESAIGNAIQNREWLRLGFSEKPQSSQPPRPTQP